MTQQSDRKPVDILLVQDCPEQVRHVRQTLRLGNFTNRLHTVGNGSEAMAYLRHEEPYVEAPEPGLILLDFGLQHKTGIDVLAEMKATPGFRHIPVVVLTHPGLERYLHDKVPTLADYFISKPVDLPQFTDAIRSIELFSLMIVHTPQEA